MSSTLTYLSLMPFCPLLLLTVPTSGGKNPKITDQMPSNRGAVICNVYQGAIEKIDMADNIERQGLNCKMNFFNLGLASERELRPCLCMPMSHVHGHALLATPAQLPRQPYAWGCGWHMREAPQDTMIKEGWTYMYPSFITTS